MKSIFALPVIGWLAVLPVQAQDVPPAFETKENTEEEAEYDPFDPMIDAPKMIRVQVEHIELSHKDLTRLMREEVAETSDAKALRMKVQALVEKDEAKVIDTQIVMGRSGQKQTTESRQEFIYPTEYEPMNCLPPVEGEETKLPESPAFPLFGSPTSFETRHVGSSLETEPTIGENDRIIDLRLLPELIWHTGNTVWNERKDELGNVYKVSMPDFYTLSMSTSISCISGQYVMAGVHSPKNGEGKPNPDRKIMVFVKCDIIAAIP